MNKTTFLTTTFFIFFKFSMASRNSVLLVPRRFRKFSCTLVIKIGTKNNYTCMHNTFLSSMTCTLSRYYQPASSVNCDSFVSESEGTEICPRRFLLFACEILSFIARMQIFLCARKR